MLSVAVALTVSGFILFYLPDMVQRPFDWKTEGHLIGLALAILGGFTVLVSAKDITNRDSFLSWAGAVLAGACAVGMLAITRNVTLSRWLAVSLLIISVVLIVVAIYAMFLGFAQLLDRGPLTFLPWSNQSRRQDRDEGGQPPLKDEPRKLGWYEWVTLAAATVAAVATVVAAAASFIPHSSG
jgi:hypothetical protein